MYFRQLQVTGEDFVGLLGFASDAYSILSKNFPEESVLGVPELRTRVYCTGLVGLFCAGNSKGVLIPSLVSDDEVEKLKGFLEPLGVEVGVVGGEYTALGNLVCANDKGAIASPNVRDKDVLEDVLGVEVVQEPVGGHADVGAVVYATNNGFIAHPDLEKELSSVEDVLGVKGLCTTVNFGSPYVKAGVIANSNGYMTGLRTSGVEMGRLDDGLGFI
ncbi:MAG: translation initiation factor IF-6 [Candidatus Altiarchaeota archaeon]